MQGDQTTKQSSSNTAQSSTGSLTPYAPTQDQIAQLLAGISGTSAAPNAAQTGALNQLTAVGNEGSAFTGDIGNVARTLLAGGGPDRTGIVNDAYSQFQKLLTPTARGDYLDPSKNPFFADTTAAIGKDVTDRISAIYQGSGRDPSGAGNLGYTLGKGIGEATAPVYSNAYTTERGNQLGAINNLFSGGTTAATTLSGLDQTKVQNMLSGIDAAGAYDQSRLFGPTTVLASEAQRTGIPLDVLARQLGLVLPVGQAFGTQNSSGTGTTTGTETSTVKKDPLSQILGGAIGGAALLGGTGAFGSGGKSGWASNLFSR